MDPGDQKSENSELSHAQQALYPLSHRSSPQINITSASAPTALHHEQWVCPGHAHCCIEKTGHLTLSSLRYTCNMHSPLPATGPFLCNPALRTNSPICEKGVIRLRETKWLVQTSGQNLIWNLCFLSCIPLHRCRGMPMSKGSVTSRLKSQPRERGLEFFSDFFFFLVFFGGSGEVLQIFDDCPSLFCFLGFFFPIKDLDQIHA